MAQVTQLVDFYLIVGIEGGELVIGNVLKTF